MTVELSEQLEVEVPAMLKAAKKNGNSIMPGAVKPVDILGRKPKKTLTGNFERTTVPRPKRPR